ncbi:DUF72 domain-containing protein [Mesorhizobium sp. SB112]|uniref:DUF72 domain-containing protein n=1 Tax=Mesorhizobium sp. SB112 TaxID=3151853 RepID=UPI003263DBB9
MDRIYIGTAGWSIASHHADAFPGDGAHIERYARQLNAVEINSSFYRPHRRETYEKWARSVPEIFRFSVKIPKAITHEHRLKECEALLEKFLSEANGLGEKLGVLLVQLPPSLRFEPEIASKFFDELRSRSDTPIALEPRHASWFGPKPTAMLKDAKISRVAADPPPVPDATSPGGWNGLAYFRMHGSPRIYHSNYEPDRIETIAGNMKAANAESWCIFDNTAQFHALENALSLKSSMLK